MMRGLVLAASCLLAPAAARAGCASISGTALAFGVYPGVGTARSTATVTLGGCAAGSAHSVGLDAGMGAGGTVTTRKMTNGASTLSYQLFQTPAHTMNWGNTTGIDAATGAAAAATRPLTVYGQLLGGQHPVPGLYTDTVTATALDRSGIKANFIVNAGVPPNCTVAATNLTFPTYTPTAAVSGASTITVNCTSTTTYTVGIDYGQANQPQNRYMVNASGIDLQYLLYQDAAHTKPWGVPFYGTAVSGTGTGAAQAFTVYGEIYAGQYGTPGAYTDTLDVYVVY